MIKSTLSAFLTNDELNRFEEKETDSGESILTFNVHGTAIKEMLAYDFSNKHVVKKYTDRYNYGVTYMKIVA